MNQYTQPNELYEDIVYLYCHIRGIETRDLNPEEYLKLRRFALTFSQKMFETKEE